MDRDQRRPLRSNGSYHSKPVASVQQQSKETAEMEKQYKELMAKKHAQDAAFRLKREQNGKDTGGSFWAEGGADAGTAKQYAAKIQADVERKVQRKVSARAIPVPETRVPEIRAIPEGGVVDGAPGSLQYGNFNEKESTNEFQEARKEWQKQEEKIIVSKYAKKVYKEVSSTGDHVIVPTLLARKEGFGAEAYKEYAQNSNLLEGSVDEEREHREFQRARLEFLGLLDKDESNTSNTENPRNKVNDTTNDTDINHDENNSNHTSVSPYVFPLHHTSTDAMNTNGEFQQARDAFLSSIITLRSGNNVTLEYDIVHDLEPGQRQEEAASLLEGEYDEEENKRQFAQAREEWLQSVQKSVATAEETEVQPSPQYHTTKDKQHQTKSQLAAAFAIATLKTSGSKIKSSYVRTDGSTVDSNPSVCQIAYDGGDRWDVLAASIDLNSLKDQPEEPQTSELLHLLLSTPANILDHLHLEDTVDPPQSVPQKTSKGTNSICLQCYKLIQPASTGILIKDQFQVCSSLCEEQYHVKQSRINKYKASNKM